MDKKRLFIGILVFGSLWGLTECIIGPSISDAGLPSGAIMTGFFAISLMMMSRMLFKQRGMQLGMGLVAGTLRMFNPFGGCVICSAIAIAAEGIIFELIWYKMSLDFIDLKTNTLKLSMGVISGYSCFVGAFIITQILTPLASSAGFYISNLLVFIPQILSRGLLAAIIGGITVPSILVFKNLDINNVKDHIFYPTAVAISMICWFAILINTFMIIGA